MIAKLGRATSAVAVGETVEIAEGQVHGFLNTGSDQLIVESEVIFPNGYDPQLDLMTFAEIYDRIKREGTLKSRSGEPPLLQMAVLTHEWRSVIKQPGMAGVLMPVLAAVGRLAGYRPRPFEDDTAPST
jgi:hypothetical protein